MKKNRVSPDDLEEMIQVAKKALFIPFKNPHVSSSCHRTYVSFLWTRVVSSKMSNTDGDDCSQLSENS